MQTYVKLKSVTGSFNQRSSMRLRQATLIILVLTIPILGQSADTFALSSEFLQINASVALFMLGIQTFTLQQVEV